MSTFVKGKRFHGDMDLSHPRLDKMHATAIWNEPT